MKNYFFRVISFFFLLTIFFSCKDDHVPGIDKEAVTTSDMLQGGWVVSGTNAKVDASNSFYAMILNIYKDDLNGVLEKKSKNMHLYFKDDVAFKLKIDNDTLPSQIIQSNFVVDGYIIKFDNPEFLGYYAEHFYLKIENENLMLYLQKEESIKLLEMDGSIEDKYMSKVNSAIDDAQCRIYFQRDSIPFYDVLKSEFSK